MRWIILLILSVAACKPTPKPVEQEPYINLSSHLKRHVKQLYNQKAYLIKYVVYNGKADQVVVRNPNWNKEFDPLFEADISAPALEGKYTIIKRKDTVSGLLHLRYISAVDDSRVRELNVLLDGDELQSFDAILKSNSLLSNSERKYSYERLNSYKITAAEQNRFINDDVYSVSGEIILEDKYFQ